MAPGPGRPPIPRDRVLLAADALFADAHAPQAVSMDAIAAAAGVGKGTLFRAFGNRDGLLDALFAAKIEPLRAELERPGSEIGPDTLPADRMVALMNHLLRFKLQNPRLLSARELDGSNLLRAPHYQWVHQLFVGIIEQNGVGSSAATYTAHILLGALRVELITALIASGRSEDDIATDLTTLTRRLVGNGATPLADATERDRDKQGIDS